MMRVERNVDLFKITQQDYMRKRKKTMDKFASGHDEFSFECPMY